MKRQLWNKRLEPTRIAPWPCPACAQTDLKVVPGSLYKREGKDSLESKDHEAWEPEWTEGRFTCLLESGCGEVLSVAGRQGVEQGSYYKSEDEIEVDYFDYFEPLFIHPAPHIIALPRRLPSDVRDEMVASFRLFWSDVESCSNRLRASIELLLDYQGIKRSTLSKQKKRVDLKLHARIQLFSKREQALSDHLMAVKWLGNAGSHASPITRDDLLDGYEIMEYVLEEVYEQRTKRVTKITKQINKTKKPRSASKSRKTRAGTGRITLV